MEVGTESCVSLSERRSGMMVPKAELKSTVARGAWFSEVCSGREHRETSGEQVGQVQNDEHLCLIAVIGVERPGPVFIKPLRITLKNTAKN